MPYLMGIDNGGTFVKAGITDERGRMLAVAREPVHNLTPKPGFAERDMEELWRQNVKVIRRAVEEAGIAPEEIKGISFSGHGKGLYLTDWSGHPVYRGNSVHRYPGLGIRKALEGGRNSGEGI